MGIPQAVTINAMATVRPITKNLPQDNLDHSLDFTFFNVDQAEYEMHIYLTPVAIAICYLSGH
jgi:hypothetical protein